MSYNRKQYETNKGSRGILAEVQEQREQGMYPRAKCWSPNGERKDKRKFRRDWKNESRNYI